MSTIELTTAAAKQAELPSGLRARMAWQPAGVGGDGLSSALPGRSRGAGRTRIRLRSGTGPRVGEPDPWALRPVTLSWYRPAWTLVSPVSIWLQVARSATYLERTVVTAGAIGAAGADGKEGRLRIGTLAGGLAHYSSQGIQFAPVGRASLGPDRTNNPPAPVGLKSDVQRPGAPAAPGRAQGGPTHARRRKVDPIPGEAPRPRLTHLGGAISIPQPPILDRVSTPRLVHREPLRLATTVQDRSGAVAPPGGGPIARLLPRSGGTTPGLFAGLHRPVPAHPRTAPAPGRRPAVDDRSLPFAEVATRDIGALSDGIGTRPISGLSAVSAFKRSGDPGFVFAKSPGPAPAARGDLRSASSPSLVDALYDKALQQGELPRLNLRMLPPAAPAEPPRSGHQAEPADRAERPAVSAAPAQPSAPMTRADIARVAEQVSRVLEQQARFERERRGAF